eukprot:1686913-Prymnesium_polylepis.1
MIEALPEPGNRICPGRLAPTDAAALERYGGLQLGMLPVDARVHVCEERDAAAGAGGLLYIENFLTEEENRLLEQAVDAHAAAGFPEDRGRCHSVRCPPGSGSASIINGQSWEMGR